VDAPPFERAVRDRQGLPETLSPWRGPALPPRSVGLRASAALRLRSLGGASIDEGDNLATALFSYNRSKAYVAKHFTPEAKARALEMVGNIRAELVPKATMGQLVVTSPVVGAVVSVDGRAVGSVPAEASLASGDHLVEIGREGYRRATRNVIVQAGERRSVDVDLEREAPITAKWWFWTGIGAAVVAGVVTTYALTREEDAGRGSISPGRITSGLRF